MKFIKNLINIAAAGDHCVLSTRADDVSGQFVLILCNAIGTPIAMQTERIRRKKIARL